MNDTVQTPSPSVTSRSRLARTTSGLIAAGVLVVAMVSPWRTIVAAYLSGEELLLTQVGEPVHSVKALETVSVPFEIRNLCLRRISLRADRFRCMPAMIEGLKESLGPGEKARFDLVLSPPPKNGPRHFAAVINTDGPRKRPLVVEVKDVLVQTDESVGLQRLGRCVAGTQVKRTLVLDNVPAGKLIRAVSGGDRRWSVKVLETRDRMAVVQIQGEAPPLSEGLKAEEVDVAVDCYFASDEVRRVRYFAVMENVKEWEYPESVRITPLSPPAITVVHNMPDQESDEPRIEIAEASPHLRATVNAARKDDRGVRTYAIAVEVQPGEASEEFLALNLIGTGNPSVVRIPVVRTK